MAFNNINIKTLRSIVRQIKDTQFSFSNGKEKNDRVAREVYAIQV